MKAIAGFFLIVLNISAISQTKYLTVEPNHSTIGFEIVIAGGATRVTGKFMEFDLKLTYMDSDWTKSEVEFTINTESINTGIPDRDSHLRSSDFFDVEKYPQIKFVSSEISKVGDGQFTASGTFTMHGISNDISIPFKMVYEDGNTFGVEINTSINRKDYDVGSNWQHSAIENFLSDDIPVNIYFWTKLDKRVEN